MGFSVSFFVCFSIFSVLSLCVSYVCVCPPQRRSSSTHGPIGIEQHNKEFSTAKSQHHPSSSFRHQTRVLVSSCLHVMRLQLFDASSAFVSSAFVVASFHRGHSGHWHQSYVSWWLRRHFGSWLRFSYFLRPKCQRPYSVLSDNPHRAVAISLARGSTTVVREHGFCQLLRQNGVLA